MPMAPARVMERADPRIATCKEIDSEDEAWDGKIEETVFQQVAEQHARWRIIERLEAQNRGNKPRGRGPGGMVHGVCPGEKVTAGALAVESAEKDVAAFSAWPAPGVGEGEEFAQQKKTPSSAEASP